MIFCFKDTNWKRTRVETSLSLLFLYRDYRIYLTQKRFYAHVVVFSSLNQKSLFGYRLLVHRHNLTGLVEAMGCFALSLW